MVRMNLPEIREKEKEICASFAVAPQTAKVTATVCGEYLVKMGKASNLWVKFFKISGGGEVTFTCFIIVYCNFVILLLAVNLFP